jgi:ATP-binding cassette subfamily B protein
VTHRLAPVADMDQIVVMERGQVAEQGTHTELLARQGIYCQLWQQQSGFALSADGERYEVTPDRLRAIPLFASVADQALAGLGAHFVTERFEAGRAVFKQGDVGDKFYIIVRGKLRVSHAGHQNREVELQVLQDGEYFGEIALLESAPRTATVMTLQPSVLLALPRGQFLKMLDDWPGLRAAVEGQALERSLRSIARTGTRRRSTPLLDALIDE